MARTKQDAKLDTRSARVKLAQRREPYWCALSGGLALGYRKGKTGGHWIAKHYSAEHGRRYRAIGPANDTLDAGVINFDDAQAKAREWLTDAAKQDDTPRGPCTVADALDDYIEFLESSRKTAADARYRDRAFIRPDFGALDITKLTTEKLETWLKNLAKQPPRLRTRKGEKQKFRKLANDDESKRRRQSSANRTWTVFKAALNRAWRRGKVTSNLAWHRVEAFHSVDKARVSYFSVAEAKRLLNACPSDFRKIVQAALETGARYGQLAELSAADFDSDNNTVRLRTRKGRGKEKVYRAVLTKEGASFFNQVCAGLASPDIIFCKANGEPWGKSHQKRFMVAACKGAKISPPVGFHQFRHTWASHAVMNGVPPLVVAGNLGHSGTAMVEKHYGHLAPSYITDAIRAGAPKFGFKPDKKVVALTLMRPVRQATH